MDRTEITQLRDLPIEGVAERLGLRVTHHKALCPFHADHHASLSFSPRRNTYRCFVCDAHGDTIALVMGCLHLGFAEACRWLAAGTHVILEEHRPAAEEPPRPFDASRYERFFQRPWLSEAACRFLYHERRIDPRVVAYCRLTSWRDRQGIEWLQTPYYSADGTLVGVQNRRLTAVEGVPRFRFPRGSQCGIYGLPVLARLQPGDELWIAEGCSDCWALLSSGRKAVAVPSATLLSPRDRQLLQALAQGRLPDGQECQGLTYHMAPDQDVPGEQLCLRLKEVLPTLQRHPLPPGCKDYGEYWRRAAGG